MKLGLHAERKVFAFKEALGWLAWADLMLSPRSGGWACAKEAVGQLEKHRREEEEVSESSKRMKVQADPMALGKNNISHLRRLNFSSITVGPYDIFSSCFYVFPTQHVLCLHKHQI